MTGTTGTTGNETNGWAYSPHDTRLHYFRHGRSLCGCRILLPADRQLAADPVSTLDICPPCHAQLTGRHQSKTPDTTDKTDKTNDAARTGEADRTASLGEHEPDPPPP